MPPGHGPGIAIAIAPAIENISAKSKLSQNRDPVDFDGVSREMEMTGRKTLSAGMKRLRGNADQELRHA